MNETIGTAFSGGTRQPPGAAAGANIARVLDNELDGARFDPLLVKAVVRAIGKAVESVVGRVDGMVGLQIIIFWQRSRQSSHELSYAFSELQMRPRTICSHTELHPHKC